LYLRFSVDSNVPELVLGDSLRLQQALFNIVMNAVKFTEVGGVEIRVFCGDKVRDGKVSLRFEVRDTGIGIRNEQMNDLFKPFSSDMNYSRKYGGMGMGLPVSNGLAALMGGHITCESREGEGSVFVLHLSLAVPEELVPEVEQTRKTPSTEALRGLRVLVAEDNKINQMIMKELLSSVSIDVKLADNGIKVLEQLQEDRFDIILMDIQMPEMDGLTAAAQIRSDSRYASLPILAMTAHSSAEHLAESFKAGMNDHLTKPVEVEQLYSALLKWSKRG